MRGYKDCMCFSKRWLIQLRKHCPSVAHHWDQEEGSCYEGGQGDGEIGPELLTELARECPPLKMTFWGHREGSF
jgi:hypothetical protein